MSLAQVLDKIYKSQISQTKHFSPLGVTMPAHQPVFPHFLVGPRLYSIQVKAEKMRQLGY